MPHSGYPPYRAGTGYNGAELAAASHESFRRNMEGYAESGTASSRNASGYRYVEYVDAAVSIYRIEEETRVRVTVNPGNRKVYTHVKMKNGSFAIRVYIESLDISGPTYGQLDGIERDAYLVLDEMEVRVVGSMYDDVR
jgi:hypothetical protein